MKKENRVSAKVRDEVRAAIEDRAAWLYLILKELSGDGKVEEIPEICRAMLRYGELKGAKMPPTRSAGEWARNLMSPVAAEVFARKLVKDDEDEAVIEFLYCPLVESWRKLGASPEETALLCKIARYGDYGRVAAFPLKLDFEKVRAEGDEVCRIIVRKGETYA